MSVCLFGLAMCSLSARLSIYLSVCLHPSVRPSVCLPARLPACPYAHLPLCLSVHLVCLYVCLFSIFPSSAANLPALYLSIHPFSICLSVSLFSIVPFACLTTCLSVCLSVFLSCLHFTRYIRKRLRAYPSLIIAIWFLIGKTTKQT